MCVYMVDDNIDVKKLFNEVKYDLEHTQYNMYEYKNSVSIRQIH